MLHKYISISNYICSLSSRCISRENACHKFSFIQVFSAQQFPRANESHNIHCVFVKPKTNSLVLKREGTNYLISRKKAEGKFHLCTVNSFEFGGTLIWGQHSILSVTFFSLRLSAWKKEANRFWRQIQTNSVCLGHNRHLNETKLLVLCDH